MFGEEQVRQPEATSSGAESTVTGPAAYRRPQLEFVGTVTRLVQSGPWGNRYETYQGSYWSDQR
jgi:hypothetical protein